MFHIIGVINECIGATRSDSPIKISTKTTPTTIGSTNICLLVKIFSRSSTHACRLSSIR